MKHIIILIALLLAPLVALQSAEGIKPKAINPNIWLKAETDRPDAIYKVGEKAIFRVTLADKAPCAPGELAWTLTLDGAKELGHGTLTLKNATATVEGSLYQPGVLQLKVTPS